MQKMLRYSLDNIQETVKQLEEWLQEHRVFSFYGPIGAGKTTLIKAICENMGVKDLITSPSFALLNEYDIPEEKIYHFDFYRIKSIDEAYDMGCQLYFDSGSYCFIEWPEKVESLLPDDGVIVKIEVIDENTRLLNLSV